MKKYVVLFVLLIPSLAIAGGKYKPTKLTIDRSLNSYATAYGGKGGNATSDALSASSAWSGDASAQSGDSDASSNSSGQSVNFNHNEKRRPVNTAAAVPVFLPSGGYNCGLGGGGGIQTGILGASITTSRESDACVIFHMLDQIERMGLTLDTLSAHPLKHALLCQHKIYNEALLSVGKPCPNNVGKVQVVGFSSSSGNR